MQVHRSCVELLRSRASARPDATCYVFLDERGREQRVLRYEELSLRVEALAGELAGMAAPGERALILTPPGPDYIVAFLGCLYAGVIAVPAYPPDPIQLDRSLRRLQGICASAAPRVVIGVREILGAKSLIEKSAPALEGVAWLAADEVGSASSGCRELAAPDREDIAFLQYTSGSTGDPKGVMVSHGNLLANFASIHEGIAGRSDDVIASWLPPYHDMGLIGGLLYPIHAGVPVVLMSPLTFLKRPLLWLRAISAYRATVGVAPNFAYELCARRAVASDLEGLELGSWRAALSGAEPVRPGTLRRFAEVFGPCGFRPESHLPVYGLAEATLMVSSSIAGREPSRIRVERSGLASEGRVRPAPASPRAADLVSCGRALAQHEILIVDPETRVAAGEGETGEIWFRGPSVARGYWRRPAESRQTFGARLSGAAPDAPRYLRSGDIGFLLAGELYVVGRMKDVLIVHGRNHYAEDLEAALEDAHPALRPGGAMAGQIDDMVAVAHELRERDADLETVVRAIRARILEAHGISVDRVTLLEPRALPKTSSGKVRRRMGLELLRSRELPGVLLDWNGAHASAEPRASAR